MPQALFGFKGRLSRSGFIEALLAIFLVDVAAFLVLKQLEAYGVPAGPAAGSPVAAGIARAIPLVFTLLTVWSLAATSVKRAHDRGRSGWLLLLVAVPVIGWVWLMVDLVVLGSRKGRSEASRSPALWNGESHETEATAVAAAAVAAAAAPAAPGGESASLDWTGHGAPQASNGPDPADALSAVAAAPSEPAPPEPPPAREVSPPEAQPEAAFLVEPSAIPPHQPPRMTTEPEPAIPAGPDAPTEAARVEIATLPDPVIPAHVLHDAGPPQAEPPAPAAPAPTVEPAKARPAPVYDSFAAAVAPLESASFHAPDTALDGMPDLGAARHLGTEPVHSQAGPAGR